MSLCQVSLCWVSWLSGGGTIEIRQSANYLYGSDFCNKHFEIGRKTSLKQLSAKLGWFFKKKKSILFTKMVIWGPFRAFKFGPVRSEASTWFAIQIDSQKRVAFSPAFFSAGLAWCWLTVDDLAYYGHNHFSYFKAISINSYKTNF